MNQISTLGELKKSGWESKSIKDEIRNNLIKKISEKDIEITLEVFD
jgi:magnesium chelatase subunit I